MQTMEKVEIVYCDLCDKATYVSAMMYHYQNPCSSFVLGYDCMCLEADDWQCRCEVA